MATRSIFKLFSKTYFQLPSCSSTISTRSVEQQCRSISSVKHSRSCSQPSYSPERVRHPKKILQIRKVSRSLQNLRDNRDQYEDEEHEAVEEEDERPTIRRLTDLTARKMKVQQVEEVEEENSNPIYEVTDGYRSTENFYDVFSYMKEMERRKALRHFAHLQPSNLKPYGSNDNLLFPEARRMTPKVVYPIYGTSGGPSQESRGTFKMPESAYQHESSPNLSEVKGLGASESRSSFDINTKRYSTSYLTARKITTKASTERRPPRLSLSSHFLRKSNSYFMGKKKENKKSVEINEIYRRVSTHKELEVKSKKSTESFIRCDPVNDLLTKKSKTTVGERQYNTSTDPCRKPVKCEKYVTVKLGELQEECRKSKKCKPKKSLSRLPKYKPGDCPCIDPPQITPAKPLLRLKKRPVFEKPRPVDLPCHLLNKRADENYVIKPKKLRPIKVADCPCIPDVMDEGCPLKRLVAKPVKEPPRVCETVCEREVAMKKAPIPRKKLPVLKPGNCPCLEQEPPVDVPPLKTLKKRPVVEKERVCDIPCELMNVRADANYVVKPKKLKPIKPADCPCIETILDEGTPLKRLVAKPVKEPPRVCEPVCEREVAMKKASIPRKKLPVLKTGNCPCIEQEPPVDVPPLKTLKKRPVVEKERVCDIPCELMNVRADANYVVKPKKLKPIKPVDCPCIETILDEGEPLKRLVAKPVQEPPRVCEPVCERKIVMQNAPVPRKKLPPVPTGNCPCIEAPLPEDVAPLKKLKKRPVVEKPKVCDIPCHLMNKRADENYVVKPKKLPVLEAPDCPCVDPEPPLDVMPLPKPKKTHVPEPPKNCPKPTICDITPRADEDDWMYWKRVEVKCEPDQVKKTSKRCFSTKTGGSSASRRYYTTSVEPYKDTFRVKYDVCELENEQSKDNKYNVIIDIKPSAPLILTQAPVQSSDFVDKTIDLRRCKSEPLDSVTFVIYKNNNELKCTTTSKSSLVKDAPESVSTLFSTINRFISTCSVLSLKNKELQPQKPFLKEKEHFIEPFPTDKEIDESKRKSRMYYRTRKDESEAQEQQVIEDECKDDVVVCDCETAAIEDQCPKPEKKLTLWERIVNYFKARPDCPTPEEYKKMRLREAAEKAAAKAGLCLYDPKEMEKQKQMPKVITAASMKQEMKK